MTSSYDAQKPRKSEATTTFLFSVMAAPYSLLSRDLLLESMSFRYLK